MLALGSSHAVPAPAVAACLQEGWHAVLVPNPVQSSLAVVAVSQHKKRFGGLGNCWPKGFFDKIRFLSQAMT